MVSSLKNFTRLRKILVPLSLVLLSVITVVSLVQVKIISNELSQKTENLKGLQQNLTTTQTELNDIKNQDQVKKNLELQDKIKIIEGSYGRIISSYELLQDFKSNAKNTSEVEKLFALSLSHVKNLDYQKTSDTLNLLDQKVANETKIVLTKLETQDQPVNNTPPQAGYSRQTVETDAGKFTVSMIAGDLSNTKVIVDTASESTCGNDCPVLPLATYVSRNNAFAGVNGSYFCPASYPTCAGKTNSFDLLLMNKNKTYFNSDNNVYSNNPGVVFGNGYIRFLGSVSSWGRDTSIDSMISNFPLLLSGGNITFSGNSDPKQVSKSNRSFVASKGNTVYIGVIHSASVVEGAKALKALGMENALNLDSGGSTAFYAGGYKVGPGRDIPNAVLFVRK